jgi:hypothetical protein
MRGWAGRANLVLKLKAAQAYTRIPIRILNTALDKTHPICGLQLIDLVKCPVAAI